MCTFRVSEGGRAVAMGELLDKLLWRSSASNAALNQTAAVLANVPRVRETSPAQGVSCGPSSGCAWNCRGVQSAGGSNQPTPQRGPSSSVAQRTSRAAQQPARRPRSGI